MVWDQHNMRNYVKASGELRTATLAGVCFDMKTSQRAMVPLGGGVLEKVRHRRQVAEGYRHPFLVPALLFAS